MEIINQITNSIVKYADDGETINSLAKKTGFAYSAVYKWVMALRDYEVINLIEMRNKSIIKINRNEIYKKFRELNNAVNVIEKDRIFWDIIKKTRLKIRFIESTAVVIWTQGSYITGDFMDKVYFLEGYNKDLPSFEEILKKYDIKYSEDKIVADERPFVHITPKRNKFEINRKNNLPVIPLNELLKWCKKLYLDNVLEHLDQIYHLNLKTKYSEIKTNI